MLRPTAMLRSLGTAGAVANVRAVLDDRERETWLLDGLLHRLEPAEPAAQRADPGRARSA